MALNVLIRKFNATKQYTSPTTPRKTTVNDTNGAFFAILTTTTNESSIINKATTAASTTTFQKLNDWQNALVQKFHLQIAQTSPRNSAVCVSMVAMLQQRQEMHIFAELITQDNQ